MSGHSLAVHWHGLLLQLHVIRRSSTVKSCGLFLLLLALTRVKNLVILLACIVCKLRWTALLFVHVDRRWGHVSFSLFGLMVQLRLICVSGHFFWGGGVVSNIVCLGNLTYSWSFPIEAR